MWTRRAFICASLGMVGCGHRLKNFAFDQNYGQPGSGISVRFVGVGCFVVSFGGVGILTDPFWSHLSLGHVAFGKIAPDPEQIEPHLPPLGHVQGVLVGHSHYDHVLDLPYVIDKLHPEAAVVGSRTLKHIFAPMNLSRRWVTVNEKVSTEAHMGEPVWLANGRVRIHPILSGHPNQYLFFHLFKRSLTKDRKKAPTRVRHYQEGMTLAYLVDWMNDDGSIAARVYVQTSSTGYPAGFFPQALLDEAPVDVGLISMDSANYKAKGRHTIMDYLKPKAVLFCHWEDFFRPKTKPPVEIVKVNLTKLKETLPSTAESRLFFPAWDSEYHFSSQ